MPNISTRSTSSETMDISPIILHQNQSNRLIFYPKWISSSSNPLRGGFRFQRKGRNDTWEDVESNDLRTLHRDEDYQLNLDGEDMANLFSGLEEIKELLTQYGHAYGTRNFILSEENANGILLQIGDLENRDWVIEQLKLLENENFENLGTAIGRARLENAIKEFEENISNPDESFWQLFFQNNPWILQQVFAFPVIYLNGETYLGGKNSNGRQGQGGTATDFLFKNGSNGSFAVIEIKTPNCELIGSCYHGCDGSGDNRLYRIHGDLTGGVVQMENQIYTATKYFRDQIGDDFDDLTDLNPNGVLIAGNYSNLDPTKQKSFDLFRKSMGKNQVYTFDELLAKLKLLKIVYEN